MICPKKTSTPKPRFSFTLAADFLQVAACYCAARNHVNIPRIRSNSSESAPNDHGHHA
jgi:hypothetical protein